MEGDVGEDHQVLDEGEQGVDWRDRADRSVYLSYSSDEESQLSHRLRSAALHQSLSHGTSCCHISLDGDVYTVLRLRLLSVRSLGQAGQRIHKQQTPARLQQSQQRPESVSMVTVCSSSGWKTGAS